jgi:hypothetical protein
MLSLVVALACFSAFTIYLGVRAQQRAEAAEKRASEAEAKCEWLVKALVGVRDIIGSDQSSTYRICDIIDLLEKIKGEGKEF